MTLARLTVDLDALAANYRRFRDSASQGSAAVVKANAYGLGVGPVARRLAREGCRQFFVATDVEGRELRRVLPDADTFDIFVFSGVVDDDGLIPVVNHAGNSGRDRSHCTSIPACAGWDSMISMPRQYRRMPRFVY